MSPHMLHTVLNTLTGATSVVSYSRCVRCALPNHHPPTQSVVPPLHSARAYHEPATKRMVGLPPIIICMQTVWPSNLNQTVASWGPL